MTIRKGKGPQKSKAKRAAGASGKAPSKERAKRPARTPARTAATAAYGGEVRAKGLPPTGSQRIALADAVALTQRYRKASPASEHGGFFWGDGVRALLEQPGCVGVRYYHGLDGQGTYRIVLVGVDGDGNDITRAVDGGSAPAASSPGTAKATRSAALTSTSDAELLENHWPCPPYCPPDSPLV